MQSFYYVFDYIDMVFFPAHYVQDESSQHASLLSRHATCIRLLKCNFLTLHIDINKWYVDIIYLACRGHILFYIIYIYILSSGYKTNIICFKLHVTIIMLHVAINKSHVDIYLEIRGRRSMTAYIELHNAVYLYYLQGTKRTSTKTRTKWS